MKISNLFDKTKIKLAQLRAVISDASQTESSYSRSSDIVALEERIMLSATPMAVVADAQAVEPTDCPENIDVQTEESQAQEVTNVVFVDSSVDDYQQFVNDIDQAGTNTTVVLIDSQSDGIDQITDYLSQHSGIESVHIVSHGTDGEVRLGNTQLNANTLDRYAGQIAAWSNSFTSSADILFYGCDLAATEDGQHVIEALSALTGADIVASDDLTGHADLGGDWDLEFAVGNIETDLIFSVDVQENWLGTLQTVTVNTETTITVTTLEDVVSADANLSSVAALNAEDGAGSDGVISLREAIIAVNNGAGGNTIFLGSGIHTLTIQGDNNDADGDLDIQENVTIIGVADRSSVIDASGLGDRVFNVLNGDADFRNLTITGGATSSGSGGGIRVNAGRTANLDNVLVTLNSSLGSGGGIFSSGALTVTNSTISDNTATLIDGMVSAFGGGIAQSSGELQLENVTVSGNSAGTDGGGVFLSNTAHFLTNVTVSANEAAEEGGGVFVARSATGNLSHVTITNNTAGTAGGGISNEFSQGTINVTGSIIAGNNGPASTENVSGDINRIGNNILSGDAMMLLTHDDNGDPVLADNGSLVQTHALLAGSIGIDQGAAATEGETDARGFLVNDGTRDLGAFELGATPVNDNITPVTTPTNDPPVNDPPTDLSSGIELNTDGGNDAFLISDTGLDASLTATTFEIQFAANAGPAELVLLSFNTPAGDEFSIQTTLNNELELDFGSGDEINSNALDYPAVLQDGELHSLAVTWDSATGAWEIYLDGVEVDSGTGLNPGVALDTTNGQFVFGQEQDGQNSGYVPNQGFSGTIYDVRIWDDVRSATEIADNHREKLDPSNLPSGLVANWQFDGFDSSGEVVEVVAGNNLSVANATGAGFISSTPVDDLHVDENSSVGTRVGFVIATGGDTANTYSLTDDAEGRFAIDSATGEITVANGLLLNHEANQTHNVTVAVSDSAGNTYSESLEITVNNVNEAPTFEDQGSQINTLGGTVTTSEGVPVVIDSDVEIFDAELSELNGGLGDFGGTTLTIERSSGANSDDDFSFAVPFTTGTFTNSGGRIELTFNSGVTNDQVNEALRSLQYSNSSGTPPASVDLEWTFDDNNIGSQGDGGALQAIGTSTVNITPNTPPTTSPVTLAAIAEDSGDRVITEAELLANASDGENDALSVSNVIATAGSGSLVDNLDGTWTYTPLPNNDTDVQFFYTISDGTNATSGSAFLEINPVNDAPVIDLDADDSAGTGGLDFNTEFVPGGGPVSLADGVAITDIDSTIQTVTIQIANLQDRGSEVLSFAENQNIVGNFSLITGELTLFGLSRTVTNSDFAEVINSLTYENTSATPDTRTREITFIANDGGLDGLDSLVATAFVSISGDITAPTADNNTGSSVNEGGSDFIEISELSFSDDLQPSGDITFNVTSATSNGFLAFASDPTIQIIRFTQADIDSNNLIYVHEGDENLSDSFTFTVDDGQGNSVTGQTFNITVVPQNDAPENSVPGSQTTDEDTPLVFNSANGNLISISDADASDSPIRVTLTVPGGTITLGATTGINLITGTGTNDTTVTFEATQALANSALDGLTFNPTADSIGLNAINILTDDLGNSGTGGALSDSDSVNITVNPLNDAPVIDLDADDSAGTGGLDFNTAFIAGGGPVSLADGVAITDIDSTIQTVTIQIANIQDGVSEILSYNTNPNIVFSSQSSAGLLILSGSPDATNADFAAVINTLQYENTSATPDTTTREITFVVNDGALNSSVATAFVSLTGDVTAPTEDNNTGSSVNEGGSDFIEISELSFSDDLQPTSDINYTVTTVATNGFLALQSDPTTRITSFTQADIDAGDLIYVHDGSETVDDSFTFSVDDGQGNSVTGQTFNITIVPQNDAPTAVNDAFTVAEDSTLTSMLGVDDLLQNDSDPEGDTLTVNPIPVSGPANGTLSLNSDGTFTYTPNPNFSGPDSFVYEITDGNGGRAQATVDLLVVPVNDSPSIQLTNLVNSLEENTDTTSSVRIANIVITDDNLGVNDLSLSGADASNFEIIGDELRLVAGATLDFESDSALDVTLEVDDSTIGSTAEDSADYTLNVTDVNESPTISLANVIQTIPVGTDLESGIKVADIQITDDALGIAALQLVGPDANLFEIIGNELWFNPQNGIDLSNAIQRVIIQVDDPSIGQTFDDAVDFEIETSQLGIGAPLPTNPDPEPEPVPETDTDATDTMDAMDAMDANEGDDEQNQLQEIISTPNQNTTNANGPLNSSFTTNATEQQVVLPTEDQTAVTELIVQEASDQTTTYAFADYGALVQEIVAETNLSIPAVNQFAVSLTPLTINQFGELIQSTSDSVLALDRVVVGGSAIATTSLSVGYVVWMLRGGSLFASFVTSIPAWRSFDLLPVLNKFDEESLADIANN